MIKSGRRYQEKTALIFEKLGLETFLEYRLKGVRGFHLIDVYAVGKIYGISFAWVIECKDWNRRVPKEKILTLQAVIDDVGSDRGFLFSEAGFQKGAIQYANFTNISLTNHSEFSDDLIKDEIIGRYNWRLQKTRNYLRELNRKSGKSLFPFMFEELSGLNVLESVIIDALKFPFPIQYASDGSCVNNLAELVNYSEDILNKAENWTFPE